MKKLALALSLLMILSANTCKKAGGMTSLLDKKWVFQSIAGEALKLPEGTEMPWLQLTGDLLQGFGGCNRLMGGYTMEGTALSLSNIGSTKKYCEGIQPTENAIIGLLRQVDGYKMEGGLFKLLGAGKELAALKAQ